MPWFCKKVPRFWKNVPCLCASVGCNYNLKRTFKSILEKKDQNFSLWGLFFVYHTWNVYRSTPIPRKLFCPEKLLVACLHLNDLCNHNSSIQFEGIETFIPPETYFDLGVLKHFVPLDVFWSGLLKHFELKNQIRKIVTIHKDFEL